MKIDLYLNGNLVEIDKDIDFVLNKQFTELSDLTAIIVDYSKTIKIPMTAKNNELFNYTFKLDRQVLINESVFSYDPTRKIPMTMLFNGSLVMDGYALLNNVNVKDKTYEITLYGQLGKIFNELKDKKLDDYKINTNNNTSFWTKIQMNTKTISDSFLNYYHNLSWNSYNWYDFWGYAPQMIGNTDTIDTSGYEVRSSGEVKNFVDVLNTTRGITYGDIYIGDGLDMNQYCEIRTYMTRPYVYVDKIIQLVQQEINNGDYDGYHLVLDLDWFNSENPYYKDLCFFPGNESIIEEGNSQNGMVTWNNAERTFYFNYTYLPSTTSVELDGYSYTTSNNIVTISDTSGEDIPATITLNCDGIVVRDRITGVGDTSGFNSDGRWAYYNLPNSYNLPLRYIGIYDDADNLLYKLYLCDNNIKSVHEDSGFLYWEHSVYSIGDVWNTLKGMSTKNIVPNTCSWVNGSSSNNYCEVTQVYNFGNIVLNTNKFKFKTGCDIINPLYGGKIVSANISSSDYKTLCPFKNDKYNKTMWNNGATYSLNFRPIQTLTVSSNTYRSGSTWTILDVLGYDFTPFTWLIDYVKKFRLFFDIDYDTKTITLTSKYFDNISYKKMTVDYSKDVSIEPVVDKYRCYNYGYKGNESKKGLKYPAKYDGVNYGDMNRLTDININNETLSLIPDEEESVFIPVKMDCLNWANLNSSSPIQYSNPIFTNKVINTLNKDGEIEYYPFYAFRWANAGRPNQSSTPFYWLSDDTPNQRNTGKYCYLERTSSNGWDTVVEPTQDGSNVYYLKGMSLIPQFDNYIRRTVSLRNFPGTRALRSVEEEYIIPEETENLQDDTVESSYTDPVTGETRVIRRSRAYVSDDENETGTYLFWHTFAIPKEVYNGYLPNNVDGYCVWNRWRNYLDKEIFNPNNKKVTCYVRMSYPDFIKFKFNQLFVIDQNVFLVNKIIDFNPNSTAPTKVELIQINDVDNLK